MYRGKRRLIIFSIGMALLFASFQLAWGEPLNSQFFVSQSSKTSFKPFATYSKIYKKSPAMPVQFTPDSWITFNVRSYDFASHNEFLNRYLEYLHKNCLFPFDRDCRELLATVHLGMTQVRSEQRINWSVQGIHKNIYFTEERS